MDCGCVEHTVSRDWFAATGDSWVVKVKEVSSAGWAASYLAKYFAKDFLYQKDRLALGFHRAWSRSRSWPVDDLELLATKKKEWVRTAYRGGLAQSDRATSYTKRWIEEQEEANSSLLERTGTDLAMALAERRDYERMKGNIRRMGSLLNVGIA